MYPHQLLMEQHKLQVKDLSTDSQAYIKDFENLLKGIKLKEARAVKAGKEFEISEKDNAKLLRFSKSVCIQMYEDIREKENKEKEEQEKIEKEKEEKRKEAEMLAEQQRLEDEKMKEQAEKEKIRLEQEKIKEFQPVEKIEDEEEEESGVGFFF